jgi:hypothetical protein
VGGGMAIVCRTVEIPRLAVFGSGTASIYTCAYTNTVLYAPTEIPVGSAIVANIGYGRLFTLDGEIVGGGNITLRGLSGGSSGTPTGFGLLSRQNTNFAGRVTLTIPEGGSGDRYTPQFSGTSNKKYFTMFVNDGRNLGGAMEPANPKGITIMNMSRLAVMAGTDEVIFDEPTRGIFIDWVGRFYPTNGQTITVKSPLAVHGTMYKEGNGVLALGSAVKFGADGTLDAWESGEDATNHAFEVLGGDVRILHADAMNGLNVTVSNSASAFRLAACPADPDLKAYGIRNVKTDAPFAVEGEGVKLNIRLEAPETIPHAQDTFGLLTVPIAQTNAVAQMLSVYRPETGFDGFGVKVSLEENGDGETATFKATVHTRGVMVHIR